MLKTLIQFLKPFFSFELVSGITVLRPAGKKISSFASSKFKVYSLIAIRYNLTHVHFLRKLRSAQQLRTLAHVAPSLNCQGKQGLKAW